MYGSQAVWSAAPHATSHAQRKLQNTTISHFTEYLKSLNNGCHRQEKKILGQGKSQEILRWAWKFIGYLKINDYDSLQKICLKCSGGRI